MIHLITLNPAIDEYIDVDSLTIGETNYSTNIRNVMGGKAVNVAKVLSELKVPACLITTVDYKDSFVSNNLEGFNSYLVEVDKIRTNLKINNLGQITEINNRGTALPSYAKLEFRNYIEKCIGQDDIVLIAGNPHFEDEQFQFELALVAKSKGAKLYLDSNKFDLEMIEQLQPEFIKPNDQELEELTAGNSTKLKSLFGIVNQVIISHGGKGFTYKSKNAELIEKPLPGAPINTVGAGDSLVAGFIYGEYHNLGLKEKLKIAKYCASATVYSGQIATKSEILKYDHDNIILN